MKAFTLAVLVAAFGVFPAYADEAHHKGGDSGPSAQAGPEMSDGEVRRVDKNAGKITLRHGPLANLGMPAMTMVFQVKDPAMLEQVKVGDKVKFVAERAGGALTVTKIEPGQ